MLHPIPYQPATNLFHLFDEFEKSFWNGLPDVQQMRTDIVDKGAFFELTADLPGFDREDIRIDVNAGTLTITAQKEENREEAKEGFLRRERRRGALCRSFDIAGIRAEDIQARYQNGVLTLELPKQAGQLPPSRQILIQ